MAFVKVVFIIKKAICRKRKNSKFFCCCAAPQVSPYQILGKNRFIYSLLTNQGGLFLFYNMAVIELPVILFLVLLQLLLSRYHFVTFYIFLGRFHKKYKQRLQDIFFLKTHENFRFVALPLEILKKASFHRAEEITHEFFVSTPGNSTSFLIDYWNLRL